jgi:menaquinone-specific isochorismate synthase
MSMREKNRAFPLFQSFDPSQPAAITGHHLPHWTQPGCTYFLTFRLHDSFPEAFAERWYADRSDWLRQHDVDVDAEGGWAAGLARLPQAAQEDFRQRFASAMERKLDELHGSCLLRDDGYRALVERALRFFHNGRYRLGRYAILPNHVHALVAPLGTGLKSICYSWKHWSAGQINRRRGVRGTVWQSESFDHIVRSEEDLERFDAYITRNPARAGLRAGFTLGHGDSSPGTP